MPSGGVICQVGPGQTTDGRASAVRRLLPPVLSEDFAAKCRRLHGHGTRALLGQCPSDDDIAVAANIGDRLTGAAIVLAYVTTQGLAATGALRGLLGIGMQIAPIAATAEQRLRARRVVSAVA